MSIQEKLAYSDEKKSFNDTGALFNTATIKTDNEHKFHESASYIIPYRREGLGQACAISSTLIGSI